MSVESDINSIKKFLNKNSQVEKSLKFDDQKLRTQRNLQHIFSKRFFGSKQKIFEIVLDHAERAERSCPRAGILLLKKFSGIDINIDESPCNKRTVIDQIEKLNLSKFSTSILTEILYFCNSETKIKLTKSINQKSYVEISNDYQFSVTPIAAVKKNLDKNCKVFVIDGFIESVSEVHHILHHFSSEEQSTPFILFCRGASNDVISTINVNNTRNAFRCYLFKIDFTVENVNILVDLAVACGVDVTSSLKGDLISSIKLDKSSIVESISVTNTGISIKSRSTKKSVALHVASLKKKLTDCNEIEKEFIHKRMRGLSSNSIEIAIPDDINFFSRSKELDEGIRLILSIMNKSFMLDQAISLYYEVLEKTLKSIADTV